MPGRASFLEGIKAKARRSAMRSLSPQLLDHEVIVLAAPDHPDRIS